MPIKSNVSATMLTNVWTNILMSSATGFTNIMLIKANGLAAVFTNANVLAAVLFFNEMLMKSRFFLPQFLPSNANKS